MNEERATAREEGGGSKSISEDVGRGGGGWGGGARGVGEVGADQRVKR